MRLTITFNYLILCLIFLSSCDPDNLNKPSVEKSDLFVYGFLGIRPDPVQPESNQYWVDACVLNPPAYKNVQMQLLRYIDYRKHRTQLIPLEAGYHQTNISFAERDSNFFFYPGEQYRFYMRTSEDTCSGLLTTLPRIDLIADTVIADTVHLQWTDIDADFYDIGFYTGNELEKHVQVPDTQYTIELDALPLNSAEQVRITIAGFKGFDPVSNTSGNMGGCVGFVFGYSHYETWLDTETLTFTHNQTLTLPGLDELLLSFYE